MLSRHTALSEKLSDHELSASELTKLGKEYATIGKLVTIADERVECIQNIEELKALEAEEIKKYVAASS